MSTQYLENIGVDWVNITSELSLIQDQQYIIQNTTPYHLELFISSSEPGDTDYGHVLYANSRFFVVISSDNIYIRNQKKDDLKKARVAVTENINSVVISDEDANFIGLHLNTNTNEYEFPISLKGHVCEENTSSTPLLADEEFLGEWQDTFDYGTITVGIRTDQDSITDGLVIQWSANGTDVDDTDVFTISSNQGRVFTFGPARRYIRVKYTNSSSDQSSFRLQTILRRVFIKPSSHRINDSIVAEDDAELVKAVLTGENPAGTFVNFKSTTQGNFKVSLEELENAVSVNSNSQLRTTLFDSDGIELTIDPITGSLCQEEYYHCEIHKGDHYNYCDYDITPLGLGDTVEFVLTTPNTTTWIHFLFSVFSSTGATIEFFEGASGITGGTSITPRNNNRNSSNTSSVTLIKDPTSITSDGMRASGYLAGANRSAGATGREQEYVLKQNTTYLTRITSLAAANSVSWCADWYEHANLS